MASWWDQISGVGSDLKGVAEALTYLPGYAEAIKAFPQILSGDTTDLPIIKPSTFEERIQSGLQNFVEKGKTNPEEAAMDFMPGAMGATWKSTDKFLKQLSLEYYQSLTKVDKKALENLTENYLSIRNTPVNYRTDGDAFRSPSFIHKDVNIMDYLKGKKPGEILLTSPDNYISHPLEKKLSSPAISYAHEGGHAFTGTPIEHHNWTGLPEKSPVYIPGGVLDDPSRMVTEGFAEGLSHALLDKYNKKVFTPYWQEYKDYPTYLKDAYNKAGYLGVDIADALRSGKTPNQQSAIEELMDIFKKAY